MNNWGADRLERQGNAHLNHADSLRKEAESIRAKYSTVSDVGKEGDDKHFALLKADALVRKARKLSAEGCTWVEKSFDMRTD